MLRKHWLHSERGVLATGTLANNVRSYVSKHRCCHRFSRLALLWVIVVSAVLNAGAFRKQSATACLPARRSTLADIANNGHGRI